jgi:hypothetical protein
MLGDVAFAQAPFASQGGNTFNVAVSETSSIASSPDAIFTAGGLILEAASALAEQSVLTTFVGNNSESASGADVFNTLNNIFSVVLTDGASGVDTTSVQSNFVATVVENASAVAAFLSQANFSAAIAEAASADATQQGGFLFLVSISEAASGVDGRIGNIITSAAIQEFAAGIDSQTVVKTIYVNVTGVQLVVRVGRILIWSQINDSQTPNWQNIPT